MLLSPHFQLLPGGVVLAPVQARKEALLKRGGTHGKRISTLALIPMCAGLVMAQSTGTSGSTNNSQSGSSNQSGTFGTQQGSGSFGQDQSSNRSGGNRGGMIHGILVASGCNASSISGAWGAGRSGGSQSSWNNSGSGSNGSTDMSRTTNATAGTTGDQGTSGSTNSSNVNSGQYQHGQHRVCHRIHGPGGHSQRVLDHHRYEWHYFRRQRWR